MPDVLETPLAQVEPQVQDESLSQVEENAPKTLDSLNSFHFKLPVFEGPLDLLLHLIRDQKIDIYDIPIIQITQQYMEYVELLQELDLEIAGEYLVMAATLIHIKSRMLLPPEEKEQEEPVEDPRAELVQRLLEYQAFKESSSLLRKREDIWKNVFRRSAPDADEMQFEPEPVLFEATAFDLISAFKKLLEKAPEQALEITRETLTVADKINYIVERIENEDGIRFEDLFEDGCTKLSLIVTFLALLEVVRLGLVKIYQEKDFGQIWVLNPQQESGEVSESLLVEDSEEVPA
jgi:segregation and condensation protein A